ncbi:glycoside hydrolase family 3 protein [Infundibulicybe gibba]|nr:glycoside hydrolase family 3 protein [Infundibulicybe gibba]
MSSHPFLEASIPELVRQLKVEEKIALLGAPNWWNTSAIERLGIPSIRMSDGPNGVRGSSHFVSTPAQCLPCATALASTFDPDLIHQVGVFLAQEAKIKSSVVLLAPTCNIQRSPLGGRSFESFSEDPYLSGMMSSAYINGLQSEGVAATIKHFVANDQEHERTAADSVMSDRVLREIYLYPFMLAQKLARPGAIMTSYGRIGGIHCSENPTLLQTILRDEWKFDGVVISDWFGTYGVDQPLNAGLDLEMPGPPRWRTSPLILHCLSSQKLLAQTIDTRVHNLLSFVQRQARRNPEVVYGDGIERTRDSPEARAFCRRLAADGMVLLKNKNHTLPIVPSSIKRIAVIGPNARDRIISGGGSAALKASYVVTPWDGISQGAPAGCSVEYQVGCYAHKYLPTLENNLVTPEGSPGWLCTFYNHSADGCPAEAVETFVLQDTRVKLNDFLPSGLTPTWTIRLEGRLTVDRTAPYELGLTVAGRAKLWIDGRLTIDNWTKQTPGDFFYGQGTVEEKSTVSLIAGKRVDVLVEYTNSPPPDGVDENGERRNAQPALMRGVRLGGCEKIDPEEAIRRAVDLAAQSDIAIIVGGLSPEWESEGFDRLTLGLPGRQDELISKVSQANKKTVVCLQAGSAVSMPWVREIGGLIQAWYSGNEAGNALADILYGRVNPGGRLPLTLPVREQDIPAFPNHRSENGKIHYREDLYVGYKYYQARETKPLFNFGFGLSYTEFRFTDFKVIEPSLFDESMSVQAEVTITNEGTRTGSEIAQLYVSYPDIGVTTPLLQLRGFYKAREIPPGTSQTATFILDRYAFGYWNVEGKAWAVLAGSYNLHVGPHCEDLPLKAVVNVTNSFNWRNL